MKFETLGRWSILPVHWSGVVVLMMALSFLPSSVLAGVGERLPRHLVERYPQLEPYTERIATVEINVVPNYWDNMDGITYATMGPAAGTGVPRRKDSWITIIVTEDWSPVDGIPTEAIGLFGDGCEGVEDEGFCYYNACDSLSWSNDWWTACVPTGYDPLYEGETYFHINSAGCSGDCGHCCNDWSIVVASAEYFGFLEHVPVRSWDNADDGIPAVNLAAFAEFAAVFTTDSRCGDWDDNGWVNLADFVYFVWHWLNECDD